MVLLLLLSLVLLLVLQQIVTLPKFAALPTSVSYIQPSRYLEAVQTSVPLDGFDGLLLLGVLLLCGGLLALEWRQRTLSLAFAQVLRSESHTVLLLILVSAVAARYYLSPGDLNWAADSSQHIIYTEITAWTLAVGQWPGWTNYLGLGSPYLQFYPLLFFLLSGAATLLMQDVYSALKGILFLLHVASGVGLYAATRACGARRAAAFIGGLAYVLCFWHAQQVLIMGRFHVSLVYALLPWIFVGFERSLRGRGSWRDALVGGVALGMLILTHPGYGYWSCALLAVYAAARWLTTSSVVVISRTMLILGLGLAIGASLVLPMWLERSWTGLADGYSLADVPGPEWWHVLVWSNYRFWLWLPADASFHWYGGYLGLSLVVLAGVAVVYQRRRRGRWQHAVWSATAAGAVAVLLAFAHEWSWLRLLPNVDVLAAGRYLLFVSFFLSLLACHGATVLRRHRHTTPVAILLLIAVDLGPTTFQQVYRATDAAWDADGIPVSFYDPLVDQARSAAEQGQLPASRVMWAPGPMHRFMTTAVLVHHGRTPTPDGPHPGELRPVFDFVRPLQQYLDAHLQGRAVLDASTLQEPRIVAGLALLNVGTLLVRTDNRSSQQVSIRQPTPATVSSRLVQAPAPVATAARPPAGMSQLEFERLATWIGLVDSMRLDVTQRRAHAFVVPATVHPQDLGTRPEVTVERHEVYPQRVDMTLSLSADAFVRLAYAYHAPMRVRVNGRTAAVQPTSAGFILLRLPAGTHDISLQARSSWLRRGLLGVSLALCLLSVGLFLRLDCRWKSAPH